ncbi:MAG: integrase arm-type DNA-binding domain-containing protein [Alphaproteobacteria bacterium]|nr:integrase arm-type DNA-binding domain-containing protein [Alphaproteobacteria bacterium]
MRLNDTKCKSTKPKDKKYKICDGDGLYLVVNPSGSKVWHFYYSYAKQRKTISFGRYPDIGLADARKMRQEARTLLSKGQNPSYVRKAQTQSAQAAASNTFEQVALRWKNVRSTKISPKTMKTAWQRLVLYVYPYIPKSVDLVSIGVSGTDIEAFLKSTCSDLKSLRQRMSEHHIVDLHWLYRFNPLIQTPLISLKIKGEEVLACPISDFLWNRVSQGVYFDLINIPEYTQAYGKSFERYIGDVLKETLNSDGYTVLKPEEYHVAGKNLKHGADWIVFDGTANIFVETKTKQFRYGSKFLLSDEELLKDLSVVAEGVVQNYKNILDAQKGKTNWRDNNLPIYSFIVTLEDWQIFSPIMQEKICELVVEKMEFLGIPTDLVQVIPYLICSSEEFELFCCAARFHSFQDILRPYMSETNYERWLLRSYLFKNYKKEIEISFESWFEDDWSGIIPSKN